MKNKESYNKEIKEYFFNVKNRILPDLTTSSIKSRCLFLLNENLKECDKIIVKNYFKIISEENLIKEITDKDSDTFKSVLNYLNNKTKKLNKEEAYNFVAWLIDFKYRPFSIYIKDNDVQENVKKFNDLIEHKQSKLNQKTPNNKNDTQNKAYIKTNQVNILSAFNSSLINIVKGTVRQFNFLGIGNKQKVEKDNK
ncbi:hypothetical protein [Polaribacter sp.]|uniref:hypothetical protein n=1 Tax=Polaribacter sp. TaxID=1920175 RepID=UPI003EF7199F